MDVFLFLFTLLLGLLLLVLWSLRGWISALIIGTKHTNLISSSGKKLPPGPVPFPIIGNLFQLGIKPNANESLAIIAKTYGPLMTLKLGRVTTIVASDAATAKEILKTHDQYLAGRPSLDTSRSLNNHQHSMVSLSPSSRWRVLRKICNNQIFNTQRLDASESLRRQKVRELLAHVRKSAQAGQAVDIGQAAFTTTLNLIWNTIVSVDLVQHPDSENLQDLKAVVYGLLEESGKPNISDFFPLLSPLDLQGIRRRATICYSKLFKLFDEIMDQRLNTRASLPPTRNNDLLDALLDNLQDNSSDFGRPDIKSLLTDIFVAGTDTTSVTLEWAMAELLHNPDSMVKVKLELQENIGDKKPVEEVDVARLPYLQAVVKETLRLHPPVPLLIPHRAETEVEIHGFTVPKDTQILVNAWAIGRDPSVWKNPDSFEPERFLGSSSIDIRGRDFEIIPFGSGRRVCPGMPLAFRMLHLMLASLMQSFDWNIEGGMSPKEMDMAEKLAITLHKALPVRAIPTDTTPWFKYSELASADSS